ncbi:ribosomal L1 domain-containing protein 1 [Selaginella moellendorffii]|nr:ribosomal L1 domain-containing protein 1 [Selaginella moellendorffii]|eukprot:XP_002963193.2 ribosomal L1 domain-containing protein 1 [Selaginella moellendorffii]
MADRGGGPSGVEVRVDSDRIGKAVDALLRWVAGAKDQQRIRLLDEDQLLYLVISLRKIPESARVRPHRIPIPHPLIEAGGSQEVCLIVNDLSRGMPRKEAKRKIAEEGLKVSKVLGFSKMKKDFASHESKRKLCGSYDLFLVDRRIQPFLSKALGKAFYQKKKIPIPVDLSKGQWKSQFESVCSSTFLFLSTGSCSVVKVARISQTREEIVENLMAVIDGVAGLMPKKWDSIMALHLKTMDSLALPIYQSKPSFPLKIDVNFGKKKRPSGVGKLDPLVVKKKIESPPRTSPLVAMEKKTASSWKSSSKKKKKLKEQV